MMEVAKTNHNRCVIKELLYKVEIRVRNLIQSERLFSEVENPFLCGTEELLSLPINMQALLGLFLLSALLKTGTGLECEVCTAIGSTCTGSMKTCAAGQDTCAVIFSENSLAGMPIQTVVKTCESSHACNSPPNAMNFGQGKYVRTSVSCCVGDACRTASPQFPPAVTEPNGKQCPGCYSLSPFGCETETVDCVGVENFCLDMVENVTYGKFVIHTTMKGCVTEQVCAAKEGQVNSAGVSTDITKAECKPASLVD